MADDSRLQLCCDALAPEMGSAAILGAASQHRSRGAAVRNPRLVGGQTIQAPTRGPDVVKPRVRQRPGSVDRPDQAPRQTRTRPSRAFMRPHVRSQVTRVQPRTPCSSSLLHLERHEPRRGRRRLQARGTPGRHGKLVSPLSWRDSMIPPAALVAKREPGYAGCRRSVEGGSRCTVKMQRLP